MFLAWCGTGIVAHVEIPVCRRLGEENLEFRLGYIVRLYLSKNQIAEKDVCLRIFAFSHIGDGPKKKVS